jgi:DASS family divalent anion:Na+ symporter
LTPAQQQLVVPDAPPVSKPLAQQPDATALAAAPATAAADAKPAFVWKGANLRAAAIAAGLGLAVRYGAPIPEGVEPASWSLLAFFVTTVAGLVLEPLAPGGWALMCAGAALLSGAISFDEAFSATGSPVLWLIVNAFFLAKAIEKTGLGGRIAELLVARFGGSTRSLGASLAVGEAMLCPGMPSTTARAAGAVEEEGTAGEMGLRGRRARGFHGQNQQNNQHTNTLPTQNKGIFVPVIKSVSAAGGSLPNDEEGRLKIGAYLTLSQLQCVAHSSALFATASAQNMLCVQLAEAAGVDLGNGFATWAQGAIVPAVLGALLFWVEEGGSERVE